MYYAMMNHFSTETSDGFQNTWYPVLFKTVADKNAAIRDGVNSCRLPTASEFRAIKKIEFYQIQKFEDLTSNQINIRL